MSLKSSQKETVICHFSDLHLVPDRPVSWARLLSKRMLGYANLKFNRGRTHKEAYLVRLIDAVAEENADYTVITGDFTSLALDFEFEKISRLLFQAGLTPERTMVLPGNHDRYTRMSDLGRAFERGMAEWLPDGFAANGLYPIVRRLGPVCLLGIDTAVWRGPVRAAGAMDRAAVLRVSDVFTDPKNHGNLYVAAMHHPPFHRGNRRLKDYRTGFAGRERLLRVLPENTLVIHGHTHIASRRRMGSIDVVGVPSASNNTGNPETQLAYNRYVIRPDGSYTVEAVRFWPSSDGGEIRTERVTMPDFY